MVAWRAMTCGPALPTDPSALSALSALSDAAQVGLWLCVLAGGLAFCVGLRRAGLATTYVRDLLHIGAGVWAFGLRLWHGARAPIAITLAAVLALALVPRVAPRLRALARFRDAVSAGDERFAGLVLYAASFCAFTVLGSLGSFGSFETQPAAAAALLALALGDGVGGLVGRRFGRLRYRVPGAKEKSLEGSVTVALFTALALLAVGGWYGRPFGVGAIVVASLAASAAEAIAPRASDNVLLPAAVFAALSALRLRG